MEDINILYSRLMDKKSFFLIAGPCVIENEEMPFEICERLVNITQKFGITFVFKASYMKANRSSITSFTGIGMERGLNILNQVGKQFNVPVVTDIHSEMEADLAAKYVDILQIPAFLSRQTSLLVSASKTGKIVNVKKGQFLSAESMRYAVEKIYSTGNKKVMLTDRGTFFGYQDLVVDFRSIPIMQRNNVPVIMDITHSLQQPNQNEGITGGNPDMIETIGKAAIAVGADGIFMETHPSPEMALSDGKNMLQIDAVEPLLKRLVAIKKALLS